jgi:hypothetical protein
MPGPAPDLVRWAVTWLGWLRKPLWAAADIAYGKAAFVKPLRGLGVTVVTPLRKDATPWSVPALDEKQILIRSISSRSILSLLRSQNLVVFSDS